MTTLHLLLPPIIGGVIGYFTNYVAIKMLFRPKKAYYLFGKKLPFTPGLIPAKREKLAVSIAKVVKENLLTEETIKKRLNEEKIKQSIQNLLNSYIDSFLLEIDGYIMEIVEKIGDKKLCEIFQIDFKNVLIQLIEKIEKSDKKLEEILPPEILNEKDKIALKITEKLFEVIKKKIESPEFEIKLSLRIQRFLEESIKVPDMVIFKKPIRSIGYTISKKLIEIIETTLENQEFKESTVEYVSGILNEILNKKLSDLLKLEKSDKEKVVSLIAQMLEKEQSKPIKEIIKANPHFFRKFSEFLKGQIVKNKEAITSRLTEKLLEIIEKELPVILESLDIENMIIEKVNSLPIEEVEGIILKLIEEELKYITLLGGVLGFLIGAMQDIIFLLT